MLLTKIGNVLGVGLGVRERLMVTDNESSLRPVGFEGLWTSN